MQGLTYCTLQRKPPFTILIAGSFAHSRAQAGCTTARCASGIRCTHVLGGRGGIVPHSAIRKPARPVCQVLAFQMGGGELPPAIDDDLFADNGEKCGEPFAIEDGKR